MSLILLPNIKTLQAWILLETKLTKLHSLAANALNCWSWMKWNKAENVEHVNGDKKIGALKTLNRYDLKKRRSVEGLKKEGRMKSSKEEEIKGWRSRGCVCWLVFLSICNYTYLSFRFIFVRPLFGVKLQLNTEIMWATMLSENK